MSIETLELVQRSFDELGIDAEVSEYSDSMVKAVVSGRALMDVFNASTNALHAWMNTIPDMFFMSMNIRGDVFSIYWSEDD